MPKYAAIEMDFAGEIRKVIIFPDEKTALQKYKVPSKYKKAALSTRYTYGWPIFGPFVAIRPVSRRSEAAKKPED